MNALADPAVFQHAKPAFAWLNADSRLFMSRGYTTKPDQEPVDRIREIADRAEAILRIEGFSDKFFDYMGRGFYSLASPVWANFGTKKGLPISCNGSYFGDSIAEMMTTVSEIGMMSKFGAGTSVYVSDIRPRGTRISTGGTADGPVHFLRLIETVTDVVSQGGVRRGNCASYIDIEHPDVLEFLDMREEGSLVQNMSIGVCIGDQFMRDMIDGEERAREVWLRILRKRFESGYPYLFFKDTVNRETVDVYKDLSMEILASNLCTEIALPSSEDESFVCDLMSMNVATWDEWKDTDAVEVAIFFLDAVMEEYIAKTADVPYMHKANLFARRHRALGLGQLGWHTLLQSKRIPFEGMQAKFLNAQIAKFIHERAHEASHDLASIYGEPELLKGYGRRNTTLLAIAPTTSSSFILGQVSPSIEPLSSNYFTKDLAKGKFTFRNPYLAEELERTGHNNDATWRSILEHGGSVMHLPESVLSADMKDVFKTFGEISQLEIVQQAAQRQKYIDQSQSLNLMIHPKTPLKDVNALIIEAWKLGVKTLYYQRSTNPAQELARSILTCVSCEA